MGILRTRKFNICRLSRYSSHSEIVILKGLFEVLLRGCLSKGALYRYLANSANSQVPQIYLMAQGGKYKCTKPEEGTPKYAAGRNRGVWG